MVAGVCQVSLAPCSFLLRRLACTARRARCFSAPAAPDNPAMLLRPPRPSRAAELAPASAHAPARSIAPRSGLQSRLARRLLSLQADKEPSQALPDRHASRSSLGRHARLGSRPQRHRRRPPRRAASLVSPATARPRRPLAVAARRIGPSGEAAPRAAPCRSAAADSCTPRLFRCLARGSLSASLVRLPRPPPPSRLTQVRRTVLALPGVQVQQCWLRGERAQQVAASRSLPQPRVSLPGLEPFPAACVSPPAPAGNHAGRRDPVLRFPADGECHGPAAGSMRLLQQRPSEWREPRVSARFSWLAVSLREPLNRPPLDPRARRICAALRRPRWR